MIASLIVNNLTKHINYNCNINLPTPVFDSTHNIIIIISHFIRFKTASYRAAFEFRSHLFAEHQIISLLLPNPCCSHVHFIWSLSAASLVAHRFLPVPPIYLRGHPIQLVVHSRRHRSEAHNITIIHDNRTLPNGNFKEHAAQTEDKWSRPSSWPKDQGKLITSRMEQVLFLFNKSPWAERVQQTLNGAPFNASVGDVRNFIKLTNYRVGVLVCVLALLVCPF